jgi:hypothetical protein
VRCMIFCVLVGMRESVYEWVMDYTV